MKWKKIEPGWYNLRMPCPGASVHKESDGSWHVYIHSMTPPGDSQHKTMKQAMESAEVELIQRTTCPKCEGNGLLIEGVCSLCEGTGEVEGQSPACQFGNAGCEGMPFGHNGERSCPQCLALYERARKNGMPASGRHG